MLVGSGYAGFVSRLGSMPVWVGAGDDVEQEGDKDSDGDMYET